MDDVLTAGLEVLKKNGKNTATELVEICLFPALEKVVKESATPFDDVVLAALKEPLKAALLDLIGKI